MKSKVILTIIDGCRPDGLAQANTPNIDLLWQNGAYSWTAQTVMPSVTLPVHNSMFRSISPDKHGVGADNIYHESASAYPSMIDLAFNSGLHTAMFYSWGQLRDLASPGKLRESYLREAIYGQDNDTHVAEVAADYIVTHQPDLTVLYMGDVDIFGHLSGWMSPDYIRAIEANDRAIGHVLKTLTDAGLRDQFTILVLSDHGGHDNSHGTEMPEDMTIIWMLNGPVIKRNHVIQTPVGVRDTAATIMHLLDLPRPEVWEGQPVYDAFSA
jgi:predicted AlkP superfamily pyrophosphatase or phosphodiesterase